MRLKFTEQGRAALINARNTGTNAVTVTAIGVTETGFIPAPDGGDEALPGERKRIDTFGGKCIAPDIIHVTVRDESDDAYTLRGIGLYLEDGTLLCLYGQESTILEKSSQAVMLLSADMALADMDATEILFGSTGFLNPPATTDEPGVVELATSDETKAGKDAERAVTPKALLAALDERLGEGAPSELAKQMIAAAAESAVRKLLGLGSAAEKDAGQGNGLDADLLDGREGEFYLDWKNMVGVPASTHMPGQVFAFAGHSPPPGTLLCDGSFVEVADYPRLFEVIGYTYGSEGTAFRLPMVGEGLTIIHTSDPERLGQDSAGTARSHTHRATAAAAGGHTHSASSGGAGNHTHSTWTDVQGHHGHGGSTTWVGDHQHISPYGEDGAYPWGQHGGSNLTGSGRTDWDNNWPYTSPAGGHAHNIATDGNGNHAHNIGMNAAGSHSHSIFIGQVANHSHEITIDNAGSSHNYPAGAYMLFCIVY